MKLIISTLFLFLFSWNSTAQEIDFLRHYGGENYDDARSIVSTSDGCFVITGLDKSHDDVFGDMYLMKINAEGAIIWEKYYGIENSEDGGNCVTHTSDGGFLITGHVNWGGGICDGYIVKTDAKGNKLWSLIIGDDLDDLTYSGVESANGDIFLAGFSEDLSSFSKNILFAKVSKEGALQFTTIIPLEGDQFVSRMVENNEGNFYLSGWTDTDIEGDKDAYLLKLDRTGTVLWSKIYGTANRDQAWNLVAGLDGGVTVVGGSKSETAEQGFIATFASNGEIHSYTTLLDEIGESFLFDLKLNASNTLEACGSFKSDLDEYKKPCLIRFNSALEVESKTVFESEGPGYFRSFAYLKSDGHILVGNVKKGDENDNILIGKILGSQSAEIQELTLNLNYQLFPNPFTEFTYLKVSGGNNELKEITIYSIEGREVFKDVFSSSEYLLMRNNLPSGIYYFTVLTTDGLEISSGKLIAE